MPGISLGVGETTGARLTKTHFTKLQNKNIDYIWTRVSKFATVYETHTHAEAQNSRWLEPKGQGAAGRPLREYSLGPASKTASRTDPGTLAVQVAFQKPVSSFP